MGNMLLEDGRKGICFYIVAESLAELCFTVLWKAEFVRINGSIYLCCQCWRCGSIFFFPERKKRDKRASELGMLEILSLPRLQTILKLGHLLSGKCALRRTPTMFLDNLLLVPRKDQRSEYSITQGLFGGISHVTCGFPRPSQQKPSIEMGLSRKICGGASCLIEWIPEPYTGDPHRSWECLANRDTATLQWKRQREGKMEESCQTPQTIQPGNEHLKSTQERKGASKVRPWGRKVGATEDYSQALKPYVVFPGGFLICITTSFFLSISPFLNGNVCRCILCPSYCCVLGTDNMFSSVTSPWMEKRFSPGSVLSRASPTPNLDDLCDEVGDFWVDDT